jgi:N-acylneuraminate cytidylyltransferase
MWRIDPDNGQMTNLLDVPGIAEPYNAPRQVLPLVYWQTGHVDAIRSRAILEMDSMSGRVILPVMIDPRYTVDIDTPADWQRYEWLVSSGLEMVLPGPGRRPLPDKVALVVFDFDGVMTDNRVWVDQDGREMVAASRAEGPGLRGLEAIGVRTLVLSTEVNPVVTARCRKLQVPVLQGQQDKAAALLAYLQVEKIDAGQVVYLGNDVNDLPCFPIVGCSVVVADAEPVVLRQADLVLTRTGGHGAVRELCEIILSRQGGKVLL